MLVACRRLSQAIQSSMVGLEEGLKALMIERAGESAFPQHTFSFSPYSR